MLKSIPTVFITKRENVRFMELKEEILLENDRRVHFLFKLSHSLNNFSLV